MSTYNIINFYNNNYYYVTLTITVIEGQSSLPYKNTMSRFRCCLGVAGTKYN